MQWLPSHSAGSTGSLRGPGLRTDTEPLLTCVASRWPWWSLRRNAPETMGRRGGSQSSKEVTGSRRVASSPPFPSAPKGSMTLSYPAAATAAKSLQSCPTLCDPIDGSPPGSPVSGSLQARILEWVAISFSRGSSQPRDRSGIPYTGRQVLYH